MPNIQPQLGGGMNAGWDASTNSFVISNDAPGFIWVRVYGRVNSDDENIYYYYFEEVEWTTKGFTTKDGGIKMDQATQAKGPKMYPMPFIFDRKDYNGSANNISFQSGAIVPAQSVGVDEDGREVYYFWCGVNPNNRYFVKIDSNGEGRPVIVAGKYSATVASVSPYSNPPIYGGSYSGNVWAIEINGSPLLPGRAYTGFSSGFWNPGDPSVPNAVGYNDNRPIVVCIKNGGSGPNAIKVVTGATNNGGSLVFTYATFCPDEYTSVIFQESQGLRLFDLLDTPKTYGLPNQLLATNGVDGFQYINSANVGIQWPTPPASGNGLMMMNSGGGVFISPAQSISSGFSVVVSGSFVSGISIKLENDMGDPAPNMYYGTDDNGIRGWYPLP